MIGKIEDRVSLEENPAPEVKLFRDFSISIFSFIRFL